MDEYGPAAAVGVIVVMLILKSTGLLATMIVGPMMDVMMAVTTSSEPGGMQSPFLAKMMQPIMRYMMDTSMHVTAHYNDASYKEVQDFMVPASVGKPFLDLPGTFDESMRPRMKDIGFFGMMQMYRQVMERSGPPHNEGISWAKFQEHRGYACPGYAPKHPTVGKVVPDGRLLSISGGAPSKLMAEVKKLAKAADCDKVVICFDAITCPFFRAYAAEDLYKVTNGVPCLHVYIREAEPCDVFDAGGMHCVTPLKMKRLIPWHKSEAERALAAQDTKAHLERFAGKGKVAMWMDGLDDKLEALYEARPWRQYVVDASTGKLLAAIGLAPFNMAGKIEVIKQACAVKGGFRG